MVIDLYTAFARVDIFMNELQGSTLDKLAEAQRLQAEAEAANAKMQLEKAQRVERRWKTVLKEGGVLAVLLTLVFELVKGLIMNGATP